MQEEGDRPQATASSRLDGSCQVSRTPQGQRQQGPEPYSGNAKARDQAVILNSNSSADLYNKSEKHKNIIVQLEYKINERTNVHESVLHIHTRRGLTNYDNYTRPGPERNPKRKLN